MRRVCQLSVNANPCELKHCSPDQPVVPAEGEATARRAHGMMKRASVGLHLISGIALT